MPKDEWKVQVMSFLKKAGDDIKRVGDDVKQETTRLMEEMRDPAKQAMAREKLADLGTWAKKAAQDAATIAETAIQKVEDGLAGASDLVSEKVGGGARKPAPKSAAKPSVEREPSGSGKKAATKTVGRKSPGAAKKGAGPKAPVKKTVGRKKG